MRSLFVLGISLSVLAMGVVGCAGQAPPPAPPDAAPVPAASDGPTRPESDPPPEPECTRDADCTEGMTCQEELRAACPVCDGGTMVHVCRPPRP